MDMVDHLSNKLILQNPITVYKKNIFFNIYCKLFLVK